MRENGEHDKSFQTISVLLLSTHSRIVVRVRRRSKYVLRPEKATTIHCFGILNCPFQDYFLDPPLIILKIKISAGGMGANSGGELEGFSLKSSENPLNKLKNYRAKNF